MSTQALSAPISSLLLLLQIQAARWKAATPDQLTGAHLYLDIAWVRLPFSCSWKCYDIVKLVTFVTCIEFMILFITLLFIKKSVNLQPLSDIYQKCGCRGIYLIYANASNCRAGVEINCMYRFLHVNQITMVQMYKLSCSELYFIPNRER